MKICSLQMLELCRDHQITFVTLNGFCPFNKPPPQPLYSLQTISSWMEYQPKLKKYTPYLHCSSCSKSTSYKNL